MSPCPALPCPALPHPPPCSHNSRFLLIWLTLLPFTLWDTCHWGMLPVTGLVAFLLLGIKEIGGELGRRLAADRREREGGGLDATSGPVCEAGAAGRWALCATLSSALGSVLRVPACLTPSCPGPPALPCPSCLCSDD